MNSFVEKLKAEIGFEQDDSLLRQSRAAASFDAVIAFALAYDEILQANELALQQQNISHVLNETLSGLKFNGLAVSTYSCSKQFRVGMAIATYIRICCV